LRLNRATMKSAHVLQVLALVCPATACGSATPSTVPAQPPGAASTAGAAVAELVRKGNAAARAGDTVRAEQYLTLAIERGADRRAVLPTLLSVCLASSRLRAALNHARSYLQDNPDDSRLRYLVASLHLSLGQRPEARRALKLLLRQDPKTADAHYLYAVLEIDEAPASARDHLRTYLSLAPAGRHAPEARSRLAELLIAEESGVPLAQTAGPSDPSWREVQTGVAP